MKPLPLLGAACALLLGGCTPDLPTDIACAPLPEVVGGRDDGITELCLQLEAARELLLQLVLQPDDLGHGQCAEVDHRRRTIPELARAAKQSRGKTCVPCRPVYTACIAKCLYCTMVFKPPRG